MKSYYENNSLNDENSRISDVFDFFEHFIFLKQMVKIRSIFSFLKQTACFLAMTQRSSQSDAAEKGLANKFQEKTSFLRLIFIFLATSPTTTHTWSQERKR